MSNKTFDGIIFDLDGTLWDARKSICGTWNKVLREHFPHLGQLTVEHFNQQMGKLLPDIGRSLFPQEPEDSIDRLLELCCSEENEYIRHHGGELFEGLEEMLERLSRDAKLYIVSNCQSGYIEAFFEAHGLENYFADIQDSGAPGSCKANNIKEVVRRNGICRPVYVGDTHLDGESSREAGVPFIWANYGFGNTVEYDDIAMSVSELPEVCSRLAARLYS